jgi:hypothetical protein
MICYAAMHAGLLTDTAGSEFTIKTQEEKKEYPCALGDNPCKVNGVESKTKENWEKNFIFTNNKTKSRFFNLAYNGWPVEHKLSEYASSDKKAGWAWEMLPDQSA